MTPPAFAVVNCVATADYALLLKALDEQGFVTVTLRGASVRDKDTLLRQAAVDLPAVEDMEPHNWDALADYLWNGLYDIEGDHVALVWTAAHHLVTGDLQDFLDAVRVLTDVSRSVMSGEGGFPRPLTFLIFLVGDGAGFRRWG